MENMDKGLAVPKKTLNAPKFICPNCLPKPQKIGISINKKAFIGRPQSAVVPFIQGQLIK